MRHRGKKELVRLEREEVLLLRRIAAAVERIAARLDAEAGSGGMTEEEMARLDRARQTLQASAEPLSSAVNNQAKTGE